MILDLLKRHNSRGCYDAVSKEWQTFFEAKNFGHLKISQHDVEQFVKVVKPRRRKQLIKSIWLNVELKSYNCRLCGWAESNSWQGENKTIIENAAMDLFGSLKSWRRSGGRDLALELIAYSLSDREHWQQHCFVGSPGEDGPIGEIHDPKHGFEHGRQVKPSDAEAIDRFLGNNYMFPPKAVSRLFGSFPRLGTLVWEPWRKWDTGCFQREFWDKRYDKCINQILPTSLERVSVFEDLNEGYAHRLLLMWGPMANSMRIASPFLGSAFSSRSIQQEELSVSFMVDAEHFFQACQPEWRCKQLRSLALTSRSMTPLREEEVTNLLLKASNAAMLMPKLQTMILWNGAKGEACAFTYNRADSSVTWRGTWEMKPGQKVANAWRKMDHENCRQPFRVKSEVISNKILSHGDAVHHLGLPASVIDPVSLWQIRNEHLLNYREPGE
ncbi:hypothetical protein B0J15DRAFT_541102 [Fusarium solani]|uniref:DUF6546 domain-containing protein n=1 Tax=Fusarium solani TaxID=169388 RepID=A0A9P9RF20_FUSSL|nr:uncharacterized protein B0J15DRAFT_541102 [Fusarium solani]KAH7276128.1 hypothetical protein B0J15DRAFT_541102 [Fusarium solani]